VIDRRVPLESVMDPQAEIESKARFFLEGRQKAQGYWLQRLALAGAALALLVLAGTGTLPGHPDEKPDARRIARLIDQLGDDSYAKREAASKELEAIGVPAFAALRKATSCDDLEIRLRASRVLRAIAARLEVRRFQGHGDGVIAVALSPDGKLALSGPVCYTSKDSAARLWEVQTGKEVRRLEGHTGGVYCVAFSPDGKRALTGGDRTVRVWDVASGRELQRLAGHTDHVYDAVFSPSGKEVLSCSVDRTARLWDLATGKEKKRFVGHRAWVRRVAFAPDGKRVLTRGVFTDQAMRLWDVASGRELRRFGLEYPPSSQGTLGAVAIAFSPDGKLIASAGQDQRARLWDATTGKEVRRLEGHTGEVCAVAFSPDGKRLLTGAEDGTVRLWGVGTGEELCQLSGHTHRVWAIACSADGRHALSSSFDRTLRLWRLP
jgi:WD40 repeat protein